MRSGTQRLSRVVRSVGLALGLVLAASVATPIHAATGHRVVQAVGVVPLDPEQLSPEPPRDVAVRAAVTQAVRGVARDLLSADFIPPPDALGGQGGDAGGPVGAPSSLEERLAAILGDDSFSYTARYRILEDRGIRPALLSLDPEVEQEYVALVEVEVDEGRVAARLRSAGWIGAPAGSGGEGRIRIVIDSLQSYAAYDALRATLVDRLGARSALPVAMERGRAVLDVETRQGTALLLDDLMHEAPPELRVVLLAQEPGSLTLLLDWVPVVPADPSESRLGDSELR